VGGVNFGETYAPISNVSTQLYLLSFVARNEWKNSPFGRLTAFLNPKVDAEVYMQLPDGIEWLEPTPPSEPITSGRCVLRLNKALYGLWQAPRLWHQEIDGFLQSIGFH